MDFMNSKGSELDTLETSNNSEQSKLFSQELEDVYLRKSTEINPNSGKDHTIHSNNSCESHKFFDSKNIRFRGLRNMLAIAALDECIDWLNSGGMVAIHDATNSNTARRKQLLEHIKATGKGIDVLFVGKNLFTFLFHSFFA